MNYAIYFGLSFAVCFMAIILCAIILCWVGDIILEDEEDDTVYKEPMD